MNFKRISWLFTCIFFLGTMQSLSAQTLKEVFNSQQTPLFYLGVDFTLARAIDAPEPAMDMRDSYFPAINYLIINEPKKYDIPAAFHRSSMDHDMSLVEKRNAKINPDEIKSSSSADYARLKETDIKSLISSWDFSGKKGIGVLFVIEGMSKVQKGASIWVTLVDMETKNLLMTERMVGKTSIAFGFRNYWANPIRDVIDQVEKYKYEEWKAKYNAG